MDQRKDPHGETAIFSTLDTNIRYRQVEIEKAYKPGFPITLQYERYRLVRMRLGLSYASGTFQTVMDGILSTASYQFALIYLDDIAIISEATQEHLARSANAIFFKQNGRLTQAEIFRLFTETKLNLWKVILLWCFENVSHRRKDIDELKTPKTITNFRSYSGLCNVFRQFVFNFEWLAAV